MGTRGAWGFTNGKVKEDKVEYNHYDSYPEELGTQVKNHIQVKTLEELQALAALVQLVEPDSKPTTKQIAMCKEAETVNLEVGTQSENDWYCLLHKAQGSFATREQVPLMIDSKDFLRDSLFCEWAYLFNTETGKLEVYRGFNTKEGRPGRYADLLEKEPYKEYRGVILIAEYTIEQLKALSDDEFVAELNEAEKEYANDE